MKWSTTRTSTLSKLTNRSSVSFKSRKSFRIWISSIKLIDWHWSSGKSGHRIFKNHILVFTHARLPSLPFPRLAHWLKESDGVCPSHQQELRPTAAGNPLEECSTLREPLAQRRAFSKCWAAPQFRRNRSHNSSSRIRQQINLGRRRAKSFFSILR